MNYYLEKQYSQDLPLNAKRDLNIFFFNSFFRNSKRILDIGCSLGRVISLDPKRIEGIDLDEDAIKIASDKGYNVMQADARRKLPFLDNSFEGVFCSHLIEHLENPLHLMKEIRRILKKEGRAVILTPDYIKTSRKYVNGFWCDYTHKTPFIPQSLKKIAHDAGFKSFRVYHFPGKGFRNLLRSKYLSKESWIWLNKFPFIWRNQDLVLELINK